MITGKALVRDVDSCSTSALWWLGQHSFILKVGGKIIYIDPFLSPLAGRRVPPLLNAPDVTHADYICGTHDHTDHIDREIWPELARSSPKATFVVPEMLREALSKDLNVAASRFVGLDDSESVKLDGLRISAVAAAHELLSPDAETGRFAFLGYIIEAAGKTIYHAGDTCWYDGLQTKLKKWNFDAMLVPINGRDAERFAANIIGNMTFQEAADLCGPLRPQLLIPTHWDMFAGNLGDPAAFKRYVNVKYPDVPVLVPDYGKRITLGETKLNRQRISAPSV